MNKKGMGFFGIVLVLIFGTVGYLASQQVDFDVDKFKSNLTWEYKEIVVESQPELGNALESLINGLGDAAFSFARWTADYASENPNVSYKLIIWLVVLSLLAPIIVMLVKLIVIIVLLIKEFIQSRREKKKYSRYHDKKRKTFKEILLQKDILDTEDDGGNK